MAEYRISCVVENVTKVELERIARGWNVSVAALIREAVLVYLREPHRPAAGLRSPPGRPRAADDTLASALHLLRQAGAQPSQIARACVGDVGKNMLRRPRLTLAHVGRFKNRDIQLNGILTDAVRVLVCHGRDKTAEIPPDGPLLIRGTEDLRPWPAARIARAMKRGRSLASDRGTDGDGGTDDQDDRGAGVGRE